MTSLRLSFELFPPNDPAVLQVFVEGFRQLASFDPAFLSITYGANGSGRARSESLVADLLAGPNKNKVAAHLTLVGHTEASIRALVCKWRAAGLERLVALRGDPTDQCIDQAFKNPAQLVQLCADIGIRDISVACYPEGHPRAPSAYREREDLKRKLDAGARRAISQFFFDADQFLRFRDQCHAHGITQPIVPGLLVPTAYHRIRKFASKCGASVPGWLDERFVGLEDDPTAASHVAVATTVTLAEHLRREGCNQIHLYTLNKFSEAAAIARCLGLAANPAPPRELRDRKVA